jgi:hypothetical protein
MFAALLDALALLTHLFWIVSLLAYAIRPFSPTIESLASYGRFQAPTTRTRTSPLASDNIATQSIVSESTGFRFMYVFAASLIVCIMALIPLGRSAILLPLLAHVTRRAYECFFVHRFSPRPMSNLQLLWAIGFYFCAATGPFFDNWRSAAPVIETNKIQLAPLLILMWCEMQQHRSHAILALCRKEPPVKVPENNDKPLASGPIYVIPKGGLFTFVSSPHYFVEIVFYVTLLFVGRFYAAKLLLVAFVVVNLVDRANRTHKWYLETFKDDYPDRFRLIPSVW